MTLKTRFAIFAAMKRSLLLAFLLLGTLPLFAQATEFGILAGGSRRFVRNGQREPGVQWLDSSFSFSNSALELYWGMKMDEDVMVKVKAGRIETQIASEYGIQGTGGSFRRDVEGEVTHLNAVVEYQFDEPYGKTGVFGGVGLYRQSGDGIDSKNNFGWSAGVTSDFPLSRTYGVIVQAEYHWTNGAFRPRYVTASGGLRVSF